jgi:nitrogenase molybdenum-cofactor synthesis protein NifE
MLHVARKLQENYGAPFFEGSFYGVADTSAALRGFARLLDDPDLSARTEALIAREEARGSLFYIKYRGRLCGDVCLHPDGEINIVVAKSFQNKHIGGRVIG